MFAATDAALNEEEIYRLLEVPKQENLGDYAFPAFALAKTFHKNPAVIAEELATKVKSDYFDHVEAVGPYLNFFLSKNVVSNEVIKQVLNEGADYGYFDEGHNGNVPIDMSSPNIAKPMSMGHLRSTVIGNAVANILAKRGYHPIKDNHLGDWGTQFGKLITAYKLWGNEEDVKKDPIKKISLLIM